jgi:electron transfer flavoprotein beta subunit
MGPGRANEILREGIYRGADDGILLTDRAFAGADTLATSYALSCAIRRIKDFDVIICGRQAIDGDTAQVGPQVAEKLNIPQITYAEEIVAADDKKIRVKRRLERGVETVECQYPVLVTVNGSAAPCRPRNAKRLMKYKKATGKSERANNEALEKLVAAKPYLDINEWTVNDIECDVNQLGLAGSPTKVKQIENIVFQAKEAKVLGNSDAEIDDLMKELIANHTIG